MTLQTERLLLREYTLADAEFIIALLNTPGWLRYIGDRNVKTIEDAESYLNNGPIKSYAQNGFGLYAVVLKETGETIGSCGIIRRDTLEHEDIGYAFLTEHTGKGYAYEAASAVLEEAKNKLGLKNILAIVTQDNTASIALLEKLGLKYKRNIVMPGDDTELRLHGVDW